MNKITAQDLRKIITDLGYEIPSDDLTRRAVMLTGKQPQNARPWPAEFKAVSSHLVGPVVGYLGKKPIRNELIIEGPASFQVSLPEPHMFGHPRYDEPTTWHHLLLDLVGEVHGMMGWKTFGNPTARFLERLIPLVVGERIDRRTGTVKPLTLSTIKREYYAQIRALERWRRGEADAPKHMRKRTR